ncbi:hypothetical protein VNO77_20678 [Canavalia gladiata]|uniref:Uncharacterized protein n=1 Tax=Canavalia gladiata TaxID=3824 RepID=A0AAN9LPU2_CANGL
MQRALMITEMTWRDGIGWMSEEYDKVIASCYSNAHVSYCDEERFPLLQWPMGCIVLPLIPLHHGFYENLDTVFNPDTLI